MGSEWVVVAFLRSVQYTVGSAGYVVHIVVGLMWM